MPHEYLMMFIGRVGEKTSACDDRSVCTYAYMDLYLYGECLSGWNMRKSIKWRATQSLGVYADCRLWLSSYRAYTIECIRNSYDPWIQSHAKRKKWRKSPHECGGEIETGKSGKKSKIFGSHLVCVNCELLRHIVKRKCFRIHLKCCRATVVEMCAMRMWLVNATILFVYSNLAFNSCFITNVQKRRQHTDSNTHSAYSSNRAARMLLE